MAPKSGKEVEVGDVGGGVYDGMSPYSTERSPLGMESPMFHVEMNILSGRCVELEVCEEGEVIMAGRSCECVVIGLVIPGGRVGYRRPCE